MNFRFTIVETVLNRAEFRWKWLRFLRYSLMLGILLGLLGLGFGGMVLKGWVTSQAWAYVFFISLGSLGFVGWIVIGIGVFSRSPDRDRLGAALERVDRRLLDRLNTLLFLERHRADPRAESFSHRIARQTQAVIVEKPLGNPFASARPIGWFVALVAVLGINMFFFRVYAPLSHLVPFSKAQTAAPSSAATLASQLELPKTNSLEQSAGWGAVRITDPGRDIKVTRTTVVPLQIEAAANQPLKEVSWYSAINDGEPVLHALPAPKDRRYAVYQPTLDLGEMELSNWDVISYYARATTERSNGYASQVYFIEVRPQREEMAGMPGGEDGKAYRFLNALSGLISSQQQVIRQTHEQALLGPEEPPRERQKLAAGERDLGDSARSLHAEMSGALETSVPPDSLEQLGKAEKSLDRAGKLLEENAMAEAEKGELRALTELTSARREFQSMVGENPKALEEPEPSKGGTSNQLSQIAEFRNESKAAQDFVKRALDQQKALEQNVQGKPSATYPGLAPRETQLAEALKDFQGQHPEVFKPSREESKEAGEALKQAAQALEKRQAEAPTATHQASQKMEQLNQAMKERAADRQLADAYKLKQMLEQQAQSFGECANPSSSAAGGNVRKTAAEARETVNQLRKLAEEEPTRDAFGDPLRAALGGQNKVDLEATLNRLQQPLDEAAQKEAAGAARDELGKVSQAFQESEPAALRMARQRDALQPSPGERLEKGVADLNNLIKQLEKEGSPAGPERTRQGREALAGVQDGLRHRQGGNERGQQLLARVEQMLKAEDLDVGDLKKLAEELQLYSVENAAKTEPQENPELTNLDPSRMAPAYRGRIQKYFQKLSEQAPK